MVFLFRIWIFIFYYLQLASTNFDYTNNQSIIVYYDFSNHSLFYRNLFNSSHNVILATNTEGEIESFDIDFQGKILCYSSKRSFSSVILKCKHLGDIGLIFTKELFLKNVKQIKYDPFSNNWFILEAFTLSSNLQRLLICSFRFKECFTLLSIQEHMIHYLDVDIKRGYIYCYSNNSIYKHFLLDLEKDKITRSYKLFEKNILFSSIQMEPLLKNTFFLINGSQIILKEKNQVKYISLEEKNPSIKIDESLGSQYEKILNTAKKISSNQPFQVYFPVSINSLNKSSLCPHHSFFSLDSQITKFQSETCSHICLEILNKKHCLCSDNYELDNENLCKLSSSMFYLNSSLNPDSKSLLKNISKPEDCKFTDLFCSNGKCLDSIKFCNGVEDCDEGEDERHCDESKFEDYNSAIEEARNEEENEEGYNERFYDFIDEDEIYDDYDEKHDNVPCIGCSKTATDNLLFLFSLRHVINIYNTSDASFTHFNFIDKDIITVNYFFDHNTTFNQHILFWFDAISRNIFKAKLFNNELVEEEVIVSEGLLMVEGIAVDWIGKRLFYTDGWLGRIESCDFNGGTRLAVIYKNIKNPRSVAVDPNEGLMFWSDWHADNPRIERAGMDGENRKVLFTTKFSKTSGWPNAVVLDYEEKRVYFADSKSHHIYSVDYEGKYQQTFLSLHTSHGHPFSLALFNQSLYWSSWKANAIFKINKMIEGEVSNVTSTFFRIYSIQIIHPLLQNPNSSKKCERDSCTYTQVCFQTKNERTGENLNGKKSLKASCVCPYSTLLFINSCTQIKKNTEILFTLTINSLSSHFLVDPSKPVTPFVIPLVKPSDFSSANGRLFISRQYPSQNLPKFSDSFASKGGMEAVDWNNSFSSFFFDAGFDQVDSVTYDPFSDLLFFSAFHRSKGLLLVQGKVRSFLNPGPLIEAPKFLHVYQSFLIWVHLNEIIFFNFHTSQSYFLYKFNKKIVKNNQLDFKPKFNEKIYKRIDSNYEEKNNNNTSEIYGIISLSVFDSSLFWLEKQPNKPLDSQSLNFFIFHCFLPLCKQKINIKLPSYFTNASSLLAYDNNTVLFVNQSFGYYSLYSLKIITKIIDNNNSFNINKNSNNNNNEIKLIKTEKGYVINLKKGTFYNEKFQNECIGIECDHICLPYYPNNSSSCLCAIGFQFVGNECLHLHDTIITLSLSQIYGYIIDDDKTFFNETSENINNTYRNDLKYGFGGLTGVGFVSNVQYYQADESLYYLQLNKMKIMKVPLNISHPPFPVLSSKAYLFSIDPINEILYWSDYSKIYASKLDGSFTVTVLDGMQITRNFDNKNNKIYDDVMIVNFVLDYFNGFIYYLLKYSSIGLSIHQSHLDGSNDVLLVNYNITPSTSTPVSHMLFDKDKMRLYFIEEGKILKYFDVEKFNKKNNRENINTKNNGSKEFIKKALDIEINGHDKALAIYKNTLYFVDSNKKLKMIIENEQRKTFMVVNPSFSHLNSTLSLFSLTIDLEAISFIEKKKDNFPYTPCTLIKNGGCDHICLHNNERRVCKCHNSKLVNATKCQDHQALLAYSINNQIKTLVIDESEQVTQPSSLQNSPQISIDGSSLISSIVFDKHRNFFYFSFLPNSIFALDLYEKKKVLLVDGVGLVEGLAYDEVNYILYWSCFSSSAVFKISIEPKFFHKNKTSNSRIVKFDMNYLLSQPNVSLVLHLPSSDNPRGLAIDPCLGKLFITNWADLSPSIYSYDLSTSTLSRIIEERIKVPNGITIDRFSRTLYFADASRDTVESCNYFGKNRKIIFTLNDRKSHIFSLIFHNNFLYWTNWGNKKIEKLDLITNQSSPLTESHPSKVFGLAFVFIGKKEEEASCGNIQQYNKILDDSYIKKGFSNPVYNTCYLDNEGCQKVCKHKNGEKKCKCLHGYFLSHDKKSCKLLYSCDDKYKCSQYCFLAKKKDHKKEIKGEFCRCDNNFSLAPDGVSCYNLVDDAKLVRTDKKQIIMIPLRNLSAFGSQEVLFDGLNNVIALDYDISEQRLFFTEMSRFGCNISSSVIGTKKKKVLHTNVRSADCLAVDWLGKNIFWSDKLKHSIEVSRYDGKYKKTLMNSGLQEPRSLALHPFKGLLFFSDCGSDPHINKLGMSGTNGSVLLDSSQLGWPNALVVDLWVDRLWWADALLDYIAVCDFDGKNIKYLLKENLPHVFSLTTFENTLYWGDWNTKTISKANKLTGKSRENVTSVFYKPLALKIYHPLMQPRFINHQFYDSNYDDSTQNFDNYGYSYDEELNWENPCERGGGCPEGSLCLIRYGGIERDCVCPDRHYLNSEMFKCNDNCTNSEFLCNSTYKCIPHWWMCDGVDDCGDGSDEASSLHCTHYFCKFSGLFQCHNASSSADCIMANQLCDGILQCSDGSDELNCESHICLESQFKCKEKCIPSTFRCDGNKDCFGGEDEIKCPAKICKSNQFKCKSGEKCIPNYWRCDNENDCDDFSDEKECEKAKCNNDLFKCRQSPKCIPEVWLCDGDFDCEDNSDENFCHLNVTENKNFEKKIITCSSSEFKCLSLELCIPSKFRCDGVYNCEDGSDEYDCNRTINCDDKSNIYTNLHTQHNNNHINNDKWFQCHKTGMCISKDWLCDRVLDCFDGSDEKNCYQYNVTCSIYEHTCDNGQCIPMEWLCDGLEDCVDETDENKTRCDSYECDPGYFKCLGQYSNNLDNREKFNQSKCIINDFLCDGIVHCADGSDEYNCDAKICKVDEFFCNKKCIPLEEVCNGIFDCEDFSDENTELCKNLTQSCTSSSDCIPPLMCRKVQWLVVGKFIYEMNHDLVNHEFSSSKLLSSFYNITTTSSPQDNSIHLCLCPPEQVYDYHTKTCKAACGVYGYCSQRCKHGNCSCDEGFYQNKKLIPFVGSCHSDSNLFLLLINDRGFTVFKEKFIYYQYINNFLHKVSSSDFIGLSNEQDEEIYMVYLASNELKSILSLELSSQQLLKFNILNLTTSPKLLLNSTGHIDDMSLDPVDMNVYWTDSATNQIKMRSLIFSSSSIIIHKHNLHVPMAIEVDPVNRHIYWTIVGSHARIERSNFDGSQRKTIVHSKVVWPTDLALDLSNGRIYWSDMKKQTIESCKLDGSERRTIKIFFRTNSQELNLPSKIDIFGDDLYITLHAPKKILKINKFGYSSPIYSKKKVNEKTNYNPIIHEEHELVLREENFNFLLLLNYFKKNSKSREFSLCKAINCGAESVCVSLLERPVCLCGDGFKIDLKTGRCVRENQRANKCNNFCLHGGICSFNQLKMPKCKCMRGYQGERCEQDLCAEFCVKENTIGECRLNSKEHMPECRCKPGFSGKKCEMDLCDKYCYNGGLCYFNPLKSLRTCLCSPGFAGDRCDKDFTQMPEKACDNVVCHNGGICKHRNHSSLKTNLSFYHIYCDCPQGFKGKFCEQCMISIKTSSSSLNSTSSLISISNPSYNASRYHLIVCESCYYNCMNENLNSCQLSKCQSDKNTFCTSSSKSFFSFSHFCSCPPNFRSCQDINSYNGGFYCIENCDLECLNGGRCFHDISTDKKKCLCPNNYTGVRCEHPCSSCYYFGTAQCISSLHNHICICKDGWHGENCTSCDGKVMCNNRGRCLKNDIEPFLCDCNLGYGGDQCKQKYGCEKVLCENAGTCHHNNINDTFFCLCSSGFDGAVCQTRSSASYIYIVFLFLFILFFFFLIGALLYIKSKRNLFLHYRMAEIGSVSMARTNVSYEKDEYNAEEEDDEVNFFGEDEDGVKENKRKKSLEKVQIIYHKSQKKKNNNIQISDNIINNNNLSPYSKKIERKKNSIENIKTKNNSISFIELSQNDSNNKDQQIRNIEKMSLLE